MFECLYVCLLLSISRKISLGLSCKMRFAIRTTLQLQTFRIKYLMVLHIQSRKGLPLKDMRFIFFLNKKKTRGAFVKFRQGAQVDYRALRHEK